MSASVKIYPNSLKTILFATLVASSPSMAQSDVPLWARGATDAAVEFALGVNAHRTVVLLDAKDVFLGTDQEMPCVDGNPKLGLDATQQFCFYPKVKKVWVAPNRISILKNNLGFAAVDAQPAQIGSGFGLLVNLKTRLGIYNSSYRYLREQFPAGALQRLRAQSVTFDLVQQNIQSGVKVKLNSNSLLAEGDEAIVQMEISSKGLSILRCSLRMRDAIKKFGVKLYDGLEPDKYGADFFTFVAGEYKPSYKVLEAAEIFNSTPVFSSWTYGNTELEIIRGSVLDTAEEDQGLFLSDDAVEFGALSTSAQAARIIENAAKVLGDVNAKELTCPLSAEESETSYAKDAVEALKGNPEAWNFYLSTFKKDK